MKKQQKAERRAHDAIRSFGEALKGVPQEVREKVREANAALEEAMKPGAFSLTGELENLRENLRAQRTFAALLAIYPGDPEAERFRHGLREAHDALQAIAFRAEDHARWAREALAAQPAHETPLLTRELELVKERHPDRDIQVSADLRAIDKAFAGEVSPARELRLLEALEERKRDRVAAALRAKIAKSNSYGKSGRRA